MIENTNFIIKGFFHSVVRFSDLPNDAGVRVHSRITAFFLRCLCMIEKVDFGHGNIIYLNKNSFAKWKKLHSINGDNNLQVINQVCANVLLAEGHKFLQKGDLAAALNKFKLAALRQGQRTLFNDLDGLCKKFEKCSFHHDVAPFNEAWTQAQQKVARLKKQLSIFPQVHKNSLKGIIELEKLIEAAEKNNFSKATFENLNFISNQFNFEGHSVSLCVSLFQKIELLNFLNDKLDNLEVVSKQEEEAQQCFVKAEQFCKAGQLDQALVEFRKAATMLQNDSFYRIVVELEKFAKEKLGPGFSDPDAHLKIFAEAQRKFYLVKKLKSYPKIFAKLVPSIDKFEKVLLKPFHENEEPKDFDKYQESFLASVYYPEHANLIKSLIRRAKFIQMANVIHGPIDEIYQVLQGRFRDLMSKVDAELANFNLNGYIHLKSVEALMLSDINSDFKKIIELRKGFFDKFINFFNKYFIKQHAHYLQSFHEYFERVEKEIGEKFKAYHDSAALVSFRKTFNVFKNFYETVIKDKNSIEEMQKAGEQFATFKQLLSQYLSESPPLADLLQVEGDRKLAFQCVKINLLRLLYENIGRLMMSISVEKYPYTSQPVIHAAQLVVEAQKELLSGHYESTICKLRQAARLSVIKFNINPHSQALLWENYFKEILMHDSLYFYETTSAKIIDLLIQQVKTLMNK